MLQVILNGIYQAQIKWPVEINRLGKCYYLCKHKLQNNGILALLLLFLSNKIETA